MIQLLAELSSHTHLVGTETLKRVVGKLVADVDQVVVRIDVVQAMGFCLSRGLAHILAISKQAVEVELIGVFTVSSQTWITAWGGKKQRRYRLINLWKVRRKAGRCVRNPEVSTYFSWNCRKPGLTCGLAFSREVVARGELDGRLGIDAGI